MKKLKRTWIFWLIVFVLPLVVIFVAGIFSSYIGAQSVEGSVIYYIKSEFIRDLMISISTSLIAAGIVYLFIDNKLRELLSYDDKITVILKSGSGIEKICPPMSRRDFNRQEVLGYIGMLGGPERFKLDYTKTTEFGKRILEIQQGKGNEQFVISCSDEEIKQFTSDYCDNDDITVILKSESGKEIKCPAILRKDFSRAEVLGYIGMLSGTQRFDIASVKTSQFGEDLLKVTKSKGAQSLIIHCTDKELEQFDVPRD